MSEQSENTVEQETPKKMPTGRTDSAHLVYVLFIAGTFTVGLAAAIGVVWAYLERPNGNELLKSHYTFLINTFWKGVLIFLLGALTSFFVVGFIILFIWFVWMLVRLGKGWFALYKQRPIEKPTRWGF